MLIIDAYNLLNVEGVLPAHLAGPSLVEFIALVGRSRYAGDRIIVVCDGHLSNLADRPAARSRDPIQVAFGGVELVFSGPGTEADDVIEALLAHHAGSNSVEMVSSDRRLARAARRAGARAVSSEDFLRRVAADADQAGRRPYPAFARQTPLDRGALRYWMAEFGLGEPSEPEPAGEGSAESGVGLASDNARPDAAPPDAAPGPGAEPVLDGLLVRLIAESRLRIDPVDLDMEQWLRLHPPESPRS